MWGLCECIEPSPCPPPFHTGSPVPSHGVSSQGSVPALCHGHCQLLHCLSYHFCFHLCFEHKPQRAGSEKQGSGIATGPSSW